MRLLDRISKCRCQLFLCICSLSFSLFIFSIFLTQPSVRYGKAEKKKQLFANHSGDHHFQLMISGLSVTSFNSTCSLAADRRGPNQKVIGYSIFGNLSNPHIFRQYLKPFVKTLKEIPLKYPGWIVRIYHNLTNNDVEIWKMLKHILEHDNKYSQTHIDFCNVTTIVRNRKLGDIFAMTWRWLPMLDEKVDTLMSRDADSPVFPREVEAVREWLESDRMFHIMRDHPWHCRLILGGCWGVKVSQDRSAVVKAAEKLFQQNHFHEFDYDQELLDVIIWPIARSNMIAHDSYCCEKFRHPSQPFPTKRQHGLFVGWREIGQPKEALISPCPKKCRPKNSTSSLAWIYC